MQDRKELGLLGCRGKWLKEEQERQALAEKYNLPRDLRPQEIHLCLLLVQAGRPLTRAEWLPRAGLKWENGRGRTDGGRRNYVRELIRRGLVARIYHHGWRRLPDTYLPTDLLLELLSGKPPQKP
jgi:hypothetical protein